MPEINSIGLIELSSVATGFVVEDLMLKAGSVQLLPRAQHLLGQIPHRGLGDVTSVRPRSPPEPPQPAPRSLSAARSHACIPTVLQAISQTVDIPPSQLKSLGVIETFSAASIIEVADAAVKTANVTLLKVHLAMALGGKGFVVMAGDISSVQAAVAAGCKAAAEDGMLVGKGVIPNPSPELFKEYI